MLLSMDEGLPTAFLKIRLLRVYLWPLTAAVNYCLFHQLEPEIKPLSVPEGADTSMEAGKMKSELLEMNLYTPASLFTPRSGPSDQLASQ